MDLTPRARIIAAAVLGSALACGGGGGGGESGPDDPGHQPSAEQATKLSGIGDSIMQGMDVTDLGVDQPSYSFAQGTSRRVFSLSSRYEVVSGLPGGKEFESVSGAEMIGRPMGLRNALDQAAEICAQTTKPDRVVILLGANDVCHSADVLSLPSAVDFGAALQDALDELAACLLPGTRVHVLSIPRVDLVYEAMQSKQSAFGMSCPQLWGIFSPCPIVADDPGAVAARIVAYNDAIAGEVESASAEHTAAGIAFSTDWKGAAGGPSIGTYTFGPEDVSSFDCFHPSDEGQRKLACAAWESWEGLADASACF